MSSGAVGGRVRLFVAVEIPADVLERVEEVVGTLRARWPEARWVPPGNQHVTLKFLGSTPAEKLQPVRDVCRAVANRHAGAEVRVAGMGAFPHPRRARVLWASVEDREGLLASVAGDLADELAPLGYETEARPFTAHLTVARFKPPVHIRDELSHGRDFGPFRVDRLTLFESRLSPRGARYHALDTFPLR